MTIPKINSLVNLLFKYEPGKLEQLKRLFPNQAQLLTPGMTLGEKKEVEMSPLLSLASESFEVLRKRADANLQYLRTRLSAAKKIRFILNVIAVLSSTTFLIALFQEKELVAKILGFVGVASNFLSLISERIESGFLLGEEKDPRRLYDNIIEILLNTEALEGKLKIGMATKIANKDLVNIVQEANVLSAKLLKIEALIGKSSTSPKI